jgi:hypothetical protein
MAIEGQCAKESGIWRPNPHFEPITPRLRHSQEHRIRSKSSAGNLNLPITPKMDHGLSEVLEIKERWPGAV